VTQATRGDTASEQPILRLGMAGFSPLNKTALEGMLTRGPDMPTWRMSALGDADGWWVNGPQVRVMDDGNLQIAPGLPTERAVKLDLHGVDRPIAFASPLSLGELEPLFRFDPASVASAHAMLLQFDTLLRPARAQFTLGAEIVRRGAGLRHGIFHVAKQGNLLAVLDFRRGKAAISPGAQPADLDQAQWTRRPAEAGDLPESFLHLTPAQLAWAYAARTDRDVLPERYRKEPIYFRRAPQVPMRWLNDSLLLLLRELAVECGSMEELGRRTGLGNAQLQRALACLYYAGAITTTRAKASEPTGARHDSDPLSSGSAFESMLGKNRAPNHQYGLTAPAGLDRGGH
jgi:hypothetical protein